MTIDPTKQLFVVNTDAALTAITAILGLQAAKAVDFDFHSAAGLKLVIWPTSAKMAELATEANARAAYEAGAAEVKVIGVGDMPDGWDAASAQAEGWDRASMVSWLKGRARVWEPQDEPEPVVDWDGPPPEHDQPVSFALPPSGAQDIDWRNPSIHEPKWEYLGIMDAKRRPICNVASVLKVLDLHPQLGDVFWFDEFLQRIMRRDQKTKQPREWADADEVDLLALLQRDLGLSRLKLADVRAAVVSVAFRVRKNCAKDWLDSLKWDQKPRLDEFFPDTFGCDSTVYSRAVSKNFWISMVARVQVPGEKVDNMVILEGSQGAGKSSMLEVVGGDWFAVQGSGVESQKFFENLQGKMLVEIAEMDAFGKAEVTKVKQAVTTRIDRFRDSYGRHSRDHARTSVFVGTTNKDDWNRDETGARRFWPIRCVHGADLSLLRANRDQLFAEAVHRWRAGESWWEMPQAEAEAEQEARREDDSWLEPVETWLADIYRTQVVVGDVLWEVVKMPLADQNPAQQRRMAGVLHRLGWRKRHTNKGNVWVRPDK